MITTIAWDLDEVLIKTKEWLLEKYYNPKYRSQRDQRPLTIEDFQTPRWWEVLEGTKEESSKIWREFTRSPHFQTIPLVEGARETLELLRHDYRLVHSFFL